MKKKHKAALLTVAVLIACLAYITLIGFKGEPMFISSVSVDVGPEKLGVKLGKNFSNLAIAGVRKSSIRLHRQEGNKLIFSLTLDGIAGREKFAFLPSNFGKYDTVDYWDLDVKKSDIIGSLRNYFVINGIQQDRIVNIDLSAFPRRCNFKK